jgi:signal transduction histidine kinase
MLARLRESFERERRLVADASHELRTPIAVIRAELDGALSAGDAGPRARAALVGAVEESDRLAQLAEDLLVIARMAEDGLPLSRERLDARELLDGARMRFASRAAERDRTIRVDAAPGLMLEADPLRMRQALANLIDNALRHGEGEVVLRARPDGGGVEFAVVDEGPGFPASIDGRAFERFTRGDESRTGSGAGLGLALVQAIARAHGGDAEIADPRRGAVVVRLPGPSQGHLSGRS